MNSLPQPKERINPPDVLTLSESDTAQPPRITWADIVYVCAIGLVALFLIIVAADVLHIPPRFVILRW